MKINDISIYKGRNIYSHNPVIKMSVDVGKFNDVPTKDINGFNERLLKYFPNLKNNTCGTGLPGGFLERLNEGTYLAHVLEHIILDIQNTLGFNVKYGKTRFLSEPSIYYLVCEYENEVCALECAKSAVFIINRFIEGKDINIDEYIKYFEKIRLDTELGPSTAAIAAEAKKRNIPVTRIGHESLIRLGYGKNSKLMEATLSDNTSCIAADISSNKQLTKMILDDHKIPVPYGKVVYTEISAVMAAKQIGMPVVIKPFDGNQGKGVNTDLRTDREVKRAFKEAKQYSSGVIVEKYTEGNDYRILVIGGKVRAVSQRVPAMVTGDGLHSVKELVDIVNCDPDRGGSHEKSLTKIRLGSIELAVLRKKGLDVNYIPSPGENVFLRSNGNISTGGTAIDCTDIIHPDNADIAINAANALGIDIAGIDMVAEDIAKSINSSSGAVIEVNSAPGIRMHLYPSSGTPRNVAKDIIDFLFPDGNSNDFPIISVTGTNGKTTTVRLLNNILTTAGRTVGMTSTSGSYIGDKCICRGDNSGPRSAKAILANKQIDAAVLETARGGIIREGLGYDLADVGIVTNVTEDHLGIDGIDTVEDLAGIKALVAEAVKPDGYVVLNAEDPMINLILKTVQVRVIVFCKNKSNVKINLDGYTCVYTEDGYIRINNENIISIYDIPITQKGLSECNIYNCLCAIAAAYALKIPLKSIIMGLTSFTDNTGRFQIFNVTGFKVMLDYAHNQAGYEEIIKFCRNYRESDGHKCNNIIGIIGMPGDRPDSAIETAGTSAAGVLDKIYIKEDIDLRGRKKGEVSRILFNAVKSSLSVNKFENNVLIFDNEVEALKDALKNAENDDLIVVLYEKIEPLTDILKEYK